MARQRARAAKAGHRADRAKASARKHKDAAARISAERARELEWLREVERICEIRAQELETLRAELDNARGGRPETRRALGDLFVKEQIQGHRDLRSLFAMKLTGAGIEIGALHHPLPVPPDVVVRYVDLRTREENIARYPEVPAGDIVETDFVCDGETLSAVADESQDFVIANHMLEHCVNPLMALENFLRVLKPEGRLFLSLPDKRFTFDFRRAVTPWEHVLHDYQIKRRVEDRSVYEQYRQDVDPSLDPDEAVATCYEIHHHAWTQGEILELFIMARRTFGWPLEIEFFAKQGCEVVLVVQKADPPREDHAWRAERKPGS